MKVNITTEIAFQTARSGGKGGQNVNKVETMVEGRWLISQSELVNEEQKSILQQKLSNKIAADGYLLVKSQSERTQIANKQQVIKKMNELVEKALIKKKLRIATRPSKAAKEKRIDLKKKKSFIKETRKKFKDGGDW